MTYQHRPDSTSHSTDGDEAIVFGEPRTAADLSSIRRHAGWLLASARSLGGLSAEVDELLDDGVLSPLVVVFVGHMIDHPGRSLPRFPKELTESVRQAIVAWLNATNPSRSCEAGLIGYSCAACGSDLLFQQIVQELGGESRIVLPYDREAFRKDSVDFAGPEWSRLFDQVLNGAAQIITASAQKMGEGGISYDYANLVLHGLAAARQAELQSRLMGLVVWDGQPGDGIGGTASVIRRWRDFGMEVDCISLDPVARHAVTLPVIRNPEPPVQICEGVPSDSESHTRSMSMLFGDAVNFGRLTEQQLPHFIQDFLGPIARIVQRYKGGNVVRNTWGDGLYLVFGAVRDAGLCALDICDFVRDCVDGRKWAAWGLPDDLSVRLVLHAGPVLDCTDPLTGQTTYTGTHVDRAANLEPQTPLGEVYASEAFAALCSQSIITEFSCEYVKQLNSAEHCGTIPTYVLHGSGSV